MNGRGQYGASNGHRSNGYRGAPVVGLIHTPQDTEDEMNQLHSEIMQFAEEAASHVKRVEDGLKAEPGYKALFEKVKVAEARHKSIKTKSYEELTRRISRAMKLHQDTDFNLREPWIRDTVRLPQVVASDPELAKDLDLWLTKVEALNHLKAAQAALADEYNRLFQASSSPVLIWESRVWEPFFSEWKSWRSDHLRPAQLWPGSGAWDRIQDYRAKYIEIRNKAPFKAAGPTPIAPEGRRDPSLLGGLASFGSGLKWVVLGVLGVGGVVAVSSIASHLKKGRRS